MSASITNTTNTTTTTTTSDFNNTMDANTKPIEKATTPVSYHSCQACGDENEAQTFVAMPCNHYWCHECLSRVCSFVRNEIDLPIKCGENCFGENCCIPANLALKVLPQEEARSFKKKLEELYTPTKERIYCGNRDCGEFIPPLTHESDVLAVCQKCEQSTCKSCRALKHDGDCAGPSKEDEQAFALIKKQGYQTCSECDRVVERTEGCSHMTCACGYEFCYHCGGPIKTCNGCGHLEPDSEPFELAQLAGIWGAAGAATLELEAMRFIRSEIVQLRPLPRPVSADGLTGWFMHQMLATEYAYYTFFLRASGDVQFVRSAGEMPTPEELRISDAVVFSLFETASVVFHNDGTSTMILHETEEEDQDEDGEIEQEGDWMM